MSDLNMSLMKDIKFRAWTGKTWYYQDNQYLGSFIRRAVSQIVMDTTGEFSSGHESYLPNGGNIEEYLYQYSCLNDKKGEKLYLGDIVEATKNYPGDETKLFVVEFRKNTATFAFRELFAMSENDSRYFYDALQVRDIIKVGDVKTTPELLNEGSDE